MKQRGFTLVEMMFVSVLMAMVLVGATSLVTATLRSFAYTSNQFDSDMAASLALQIVSRDLQEAKKVEILSRTSIRVFYPIVTPEGIFDRREIDLVNTVDFYQGDLDGTPNKSGDCLLRAEANGDTRPICKIVKDLEFTSISPSSVDISIRTRTGAGNNERSTRMLHRAIFLRNY